MQRFSFCGAVLRLRQPHKKKTDCYVTCYANLLLSIRFYIVTKKFISLFEFQFITEYSSGYFHAINTIIPDFLKPYKSLYDFILVSDGIDL